MSQINYIDKTFINQNSDYPELIAELETGFSNNNLLIPPRIHQNYPHRSGGEDATLLMMPAWNKMGNSGVKIVTVNPQNHSKNLPSIQGTYVFFDSETGVLKAILDAKALTAKRTAATSALASSYLSKIDSSSMLMIGNGALAPELIRAHMAVRPIKDIFLWGRNQRKSAAIKDLLAEEGIHIQTIVKIDNYIGSVDIISSATLSPTPLIFGNMLNVGQHVDLVGSYKPTMRESDDELMRRSKIYVDALESGLRESGDIFLPLQDGVISKSDILGDLFGLCTKKVSGRRDNTDITTFKSVGHALEDLIAAEYFYSKYT